MLAQYLALAVGVVLAVAPAPTWAASPTAKAPRSGQAPMVAVAGVRIAAAEGLQPTIQELAKPDPGQWTAQVTLRDGANERIRLEIYANPRNWTAAQWVAAQWTEISRQTLLRTAAIGPGQASGLRGEVAASPQRHAQQVAFVALGKQLVHVVCHTGSHSSVAAQCENTLASMQSAGGQ
ncbi:MAG: hypothetical protein EXR77_02770 [Myxococcales bacterium]|nr:hypothetical protein [Myxococcales bacterium]